MSWIRDYAQLRMLYLKSEVDEPVLWWHDTFMSRIDALPPSYFYLPSCVADVQLFS